VTVAVEHHNKPGGTALEGGATGHHRGETDVASSAQIELKRVEWKDNLSIRVRSIDEEHQLLIGVLNRVIDCVGSPIQYSLADRALRDLFAYADYHFEHEDELMVAYDYPEIEAHRVQHNIFIEQMRRMDKELTSGTATVDDLARFVMNWFVTHILVTDMKLGAFLAERLSPERSPFEFESHRLSV